MPPCRLPCRRKQSPTNISPVLMNPLCYTQTKYCIIVLLRWILTKHKILLLEGNNGMKIMFFGREMLVEASVSIFEAPNHYPVSQHLFLPFLDSGKHRQLDPLTAKNGTVVAGSGAKSKRYFLFGSFEAQIKFVPGDSAGLVTAFYLSSEGSHHDEVDFEFLGNATGEPYTIHTNIFVQGVGDREQQFRPWFDPTADFHNYTIHWNPNAVVWYIDSIPIRVFRNYENAPKLKTAFPNKQGMRLYTSLWNAQDWATQGGRVKTNWSYAPFTARFRRFRLRACPWNGALSISQCSSNSPTNWWTSPVYAQLSASQSTKLREIRQKYMIYDYCLDPTRKRSSGVLPPECYRRQF